LKKTLFIIVLITVAAMSHAAMKLGEATTNTTFAQPGDVPAETDPLFTNWAEGRALIDASSVTSLSWSARAAYDSTGTKSVDWGSRELVDDYGFAIVNWGDSFLYDNNNNSLSIDWDSKYLYREDGIISIDWEQQVLKNSANASVLEYGGTSGLKMPSGISDAGDTTSISTEGRSLYAIDGTTAALNWDSDFLKISAFDMWTDPTFTTLAWTANKDGILDAAQTVSIDIPGSILNGTNAVPSVDWKNRNLLDSNGVAVASWEDGLQILRGNAWTNGSSTLIVPRIAGGTATDSTITFAPTNGTAAITVSSAGNVGVGITNPVASLHVAKASNVVQQIIQAHATQTANLSEWRGSDGSTVLASVNPTGDLACNSIVIPSNSLGIVEYNSRAGNTNTETGYMKWVGNVFRIGTTKSNSGTARDIQFDTAGAARFIITYQGDFKPAVDGGYFFGLSGSRWSTIYAKDAIYMGTGANPESRMLPEGFATTGYMRGNRFIFSTATNSWLLADGTNLYYRSANGVTNASGGNALTVSGTATASNVVLSAVNYIDLIAPGLSLTGGGPAPQLTATGVGGGIYGMGYQDDDYAFGSLQMPHSLALTNATRTSLVVYPHVHWAYATAPTGGNTNITWRLDYEWANLMGGFSSTGISTVVANSLIATNSMITPFAAITNNAAGISSIFRFKLSRIANGSNGYGATTRVIMDQFDIHVPVDRIGSSQKLSQ
jgi:hypothetical protein